MKKRIIILTIAFCPIISLAQDASKTSKKRESFRERLFYSASIDFILPQKKEYSYRVPNVSIIDVELENRGFLLTSFGVTSSVNYFLFRRLSIGLEGGFQTQTKPNFSFFKLGGTLRYFVDSNRQVSIFIGMSHNFSLDKSKFKEGFCGRIGLGIPIKRFSNNRQLGLNLFSEYNTFNLNNAKPLLGLSDEDPDRLDFRSIGLSVDFRW